MRLSALKIYGLKVLQLRASGLRALCGELQAFVALQGLNGANLEYAA